jgi:valyl-tRNA synthetase
MALDRVFDFKKAQDRWNGAWETAGAFTPEAPSSREPFVIILPPPNVTGILHVGHVLGDSVQDLLVRWRRMQGYNALYVPGVDHAGIATQKVVEAQIEARGLKRKELTREEFLAHAWAWKEKHHKHIVSQLKKLGCSLDWTREAFTLDDKRSRAVREVFVRLYEKGLIFRGDYIVNWCPSCGTAISDEEVHYREKDAQLYWLRYPLLEGGHIVVATTRPETMLGDTAIAVSPLDEKKQPLVGKRAVLPLVGRELPIIADAVVDPEFGSGFVKVTPAHDPNDFEMGKRHSLPLVVVIGREARMTDAAGEAFAGLDRSECRKRVLAELEKQGLVEKIEPYRHSVGEHDRCGTVIEPLVSREWFVRMQPLAQPAIDAVEKGEIDFYPPRWRNVYLSWMYNIRDWCISRQLWWGHRIPVWYCPDGHMTVSRTDPATCAGCGSGDLVQDENVLDTWFSSWLWTFSPLGWPEKTRDLETFHPTSVLVTGSEIIFFWVARMIMASLEFMGEVPFRHVFLTGIVRDAAGRKMSKSLGNSPDPLDIIEKYGTDAFRFTLVMLSPPGRDVFFAEAKLETGRNFVNKLWQASRLVLGAYEKDGAGLSADRGASSHPFAKAWKERYRGELAFEPDLSWEDRWILSALDRCVRDVDADLEGWRLNDAAARLYDFFWSEYCDWYLELAKAGLADPAATPARRAATWRTLAWVLERYVRLLHPVMPFITEAIWARTPHEPGDPALLIVASWPSADRERGLADPAIGAAVEALIDLIRAVRNARSEAGIEAGTVLEADIVLPDATLRDAYAALAEPMGRLARLRPVRVHASLDVLPGAAAGGWLAVITSAGEARLSRGSGDLDRERARLERELVDVRRQLAASETRLADAAFTARAPAAVVDGVRRRRDELSEQEATLASRIAGLAAAGPGT